MATGIIHEKKNAMYFITFSCYGWYPLIAMTRSYTSFYKWFKKLRDKNILILSYVIMPNHFHGILYLPNELEGTLNRLLANAKRFIAYDIIKILKKRRSSLTLEALSNVVCSSKKSKGQHYRVFNTSFDAKELKDSSSLINIMSYIHQNPCKGKWRLVQDFKAYKHSSASFYHLGKKNEYVTDYKDVLDF
ncbi:hypothetical protein GYB22_04565 [bacterium]|nr:hypothetical protein [bacterium]